MFSRAREYCGFADSCFKAASAVVVYLLASLCVDKSRGNRWVSKGRPPLRCCAGSRVALSSCEICPMSAAMMATVGSGGGDAWMKDQKVIAAE
jgi:hypothetical protein